MSVGPIAYDEVLAERVKERLEPEGVTAKKMFGGLTFPLNDNALANLYEEGLMVRVGPDGMDEALSRGKEQTGWVVLAEDTLDDDIPDEWLKWAIEVTAELPPKK
ncbi:TfoX/Sxy family protein [Streptomyces sp. NPDC057743]|uniref:TfoX/Sxy family protein n=1 Tax=Streptomyces sp. NPDC057743 TaxID=3346236 RepID=UPI0036C99BA8